MSDLARWKLRGSVRTLQTQFAEWNPEAGEWRPLENRYAATFRADGQLSDADHHNPDGSVVRQVRVYDAADRLTEDQWWSSGVMTRRVLYTYGVGGRSASAVTVDADGTTHETERCRYDEHGRKTKVAFLRASEAGAAARATGSAAMMYEVEGADVAYSAPGATTSTTIYDAHDLPSEVVFRDADDRLVSRVLFWRDDHGRLLSERMEFADPRGLLGPAFDANMPAAERASMIELLEIVFDAQTFSLTTYAYDGKGRRIESVRRMGKLSEERVAIRYDGFDNPVEEVSSDVNREMRIDAGVVKTEDGPSHIQRLTFAYRYDAEGNWTERIALQRLDPSGDEHPSNIERRTISYYSR